MGMDQEPHEVFFVTLHPADAGLLRRAAEASRMEPEELLALGGYQAAKRALVDYFGLAPVEAS